MARTRSQPRGELAQPTKKPQLPTETAKRAYLLWSPGFCRSLIISAVMELALVALVWRVPALRDAGEDIVAAIQLRLLDSAHALAWWSAIALLASACCVVQLMLAAASLGCSGLNSVLGPARPPLLCATALLQALSWHVVIYTKPSQAPSVALSTTATLLLSFSPEILALASRRRAPAPRAASARVLTLTLAKVSCAVCEAKVRELAEAHPAVRRFSEQGGRNLRSWVRHRYC